MKSIKMRVNISFCRLTIVFLTSAIGACATFEQHAERMTEASTGIEDSYLSRIGQGVVEPEVESENRELDDSLPANSADFQGLRALPAADSKGFENAQFGFTLSNEPSINLKVENMPVMEFVHYALDELLGVEYVLDPDARSKKKKAVTLSSAGLKSPRHVYGTVMQTLGRHDLRVEVSDGVHYIYGANDKDIGGRGVTVNIGRNPDTIPRVSGDILQVVDLKYGSNISLERTLNELLDLKVSLDSVRNALFLRGRRSEIIKALSFIEMFDAPANRGSHIGLINLTYISTDAFSKQVTSLMKAEGIPIGGGAKNNETVVIVPLPNIGSSAIFAGTKELLDRVRYWARLVDQPAAGTSSQYFVFKPQFARASEIGGSLIELMGGGRRVGTGSDRAGASSKLDSTGQAPDKARSQAFQTDVFQMVVVERSNSLVFNTTGMEYQRLMPLLQQLDVLPKQVLLDIVIAEVTLKDEFKFGVEWALQNGELTASTLGAFGASSIGGTAFALNGSDGEAVSQVLQTSQLVNVLSNPTMLVRDGVEANINVGSDISVVGSTTFDPLVGQRQTTASVYRKTGVDVTVTPTVNAEGVILMKVEKKISNAVPNSTGAAGNPDVFERSISTEIVAGSGQTVLLGGLISEDVSASGSGTPGLSAAPLLGWLFKSESDSGTRTELVMLITALVIDELDEWEAIETSFNQGLRYLEVSSP